jgi:organic hydroperoxide reductase OsmC/OhrA
MSEHRATVEWQRSGEFRYETYSRAPHPVEPRPRVDPEQSFVAALSSCHMLWFLHIAWQHKWVVDRYVDEAVGVLDETWISRVTLRPKVTFVKSEVRIEPC